MCLVVVASVALKLYAYTRTVARPLGIALIGCSSEVCCMYIKTCRLLNADMTICQTLFILLSLLAVTNGVGGADGAPNVYGINCVCFKVFALLFAIILSQPKCN